jgi:hypothetical protein
VKHGTSTAYMTHKCRCDVCRTEHSRRQKRYRVDKARGVAKLVDAEPLRDHVDKLYAAGMSQWDITIAAGWKSRNALADAYRRDKVTPRTMQRVLAVTAPPVTRRNGYVDATASRRRLQALAVMGWPTRGIAARLGNLDAQTYVYIQNGRTKTIRRRTEQAIADLYDELWDQRGPAARTRSIALRKGWLPPLAWDDETIDDPAATGHGAGWEPRKRDRDALVEDFTELRRNGATFAACAMRLGMTEKALERALYRARQDGFDIPDFGKESAA